MPKTNITAAVGRGKSENRKDDVRLVQTLLNSHAKDLAMRRLTVDGVAGEEMFRAIETFQKDAVGTRRPDGIVDPGKKTMKVLLRLSLAERAKVDSEWIVDDAPQWIKVAGQELGTREFNGFDRNNPKVLKYIATVPQLKTSWYDDAETIRCSDVDESAWCGCFVNWCLKSSGLPGHSGIDAGRARKWVLHGTPKSNPVYGAITVISTKIKRKNKWKRIHHVGFYVGKKDKAVVLLGGNQDSRRGKLGGGVTVNAFPGWTLKGSRWPKGANPDD